MYHVGRAPSGSDGINDGVRPRNDVTTGEHSGASGRKRALVHDNRSTLHLNPGCVLRANIHGFLAYRDDEGVEWYAIFGSGLGDGPAPSAGIHLAQFVGDELGRAETPALAVQADGRCQQLQL